MGKKRNYAIFWAIVSGILFVLSVTALVLVMRYNDHLVRQREEIDNFLKKDIENVFINESANAALDKGSKAPEVRDDSVLYKFISPEGIEFKSKSEKWNEANLELLYNELLQNQHGEELYALSEVMIYPQADEYAAASHQNTNDLCTVPFDHPMLSPEGMELQYYKTLGVISLYDGDDKTTVEEMASSLSHEYGHHYTLYYMFEDQGDGLYDSRYAQLRKLTAKNSYADMSDYDFYMENHHKYILEIAAEDYVTLMGSPKSREVADYADSYDRLYRSMEAIGSVRRNAKVQENLELPMACEVKGLAKYFYSFIKKPIPDFDIKKEMNITLERHSNSYDLVDGYTTMVYYTVKWDKVYGEDAIYTLSVYEEGDCFNTLYPLRTVSAGEDAVAYIGHVSRNLGSSVRSIDDGVAKGTKVFIVNVITADGKMYTSDPLTYTF